MKTRIWLTSGVGLLFLLSACSKPKPIEYTGAQQWKMTQKGLSTTELSAKVGYFNPNKYPIQIRKVDCDVYVENVLLGHYLLDSLVVMPAKDTGSIPVHFQAETTKLIKAGLLLMNKSVHIRLKGTVKAGRNGFFKRFPVDYEKMEQIKF